MVHLSQRKINVCDFLNCTLYTDFVFTPNTPLLFQIPSTIYFTLQKTAELPSGDLFFMILMCLSPSRVFCRISFSLSDAVLKVETGIMLFFGRNYSREMPFSSHHFRGMCSQPDLYLMLILITWLMYSPGYSTVLLTKPVQIYSLETSH